MAEADPICARCGEFRCAHIEDDGELLCSPAGWRFTSVADDGWRPIETAPEWDGKTGPFFDVTWAGQQHRYLPVPRREINCFREDGLIYRKHGYPAVLTIFRDKPTHWRPSPPPVDVDSASP